MQSQFNLPASKPTVSITLTLNFTNHRNFIKTSYGHNSTNDLDILKQNICAVQISKPYQKYHFGKCGLSPKKKRSTRIWGSRDGGMRVVSLLPLINSSHTYTYLHNRSQFQKLLYFPDLRDRPSWNSPCACCWVYNIWMNSLSYKNRQRRWFPAARKES